MSVATIVGVAETKFTRTSDLTDAELMVEAVKAALADASLSKRDVGGLAVGTMTMKDDSPHIAEHFGFELDWSLKSDFGGASGLIALMRAKEAIEAGVTDVIVVTAGGNRADHPDLLQDVIFPPNDYGHRSWILPYGYGGANTFFGLIQQRYMHEYGVTLDQLGKIAVTFRDNARLNENALLREELTVEQYRTSRLISDPIRFFDCVMRCAGASAIVIARNTVRDVWPHTPIHMGDHAARIAHQTSLAQADRLETGFVSIADRLFRRVAREDLDFLQLYDDYPIAIVKTLEDLGFAQRGKGGEYIERTDISRTGTLPINTGGGLLSVGQPAIAGGFVPIVEAVRQLRHEAGERQIESAESGLVTGIGLISYQSNLVVTSAAVLGREPG